MGEEIKITARAAKSEADDEGLNRRNALQCMVWAGTGILWTLSGGVPKSLGLLGDALAAVPTGFSFLQISDSHIGFNKPANPDALGTLREAIGKVKAVKSRPAFMILFSRRRPFAPCRQKPTCRRLAARCAAPPDKGRARLSSVPPLSHRRPA